jgi:tRNA(Ile)-lysidine synthase TilS/MesJ
MNFIKGTGINGLQGMRPQEGGIGGIVIRPLLFAKKEEVLAYATANNLVWREDQSNQSNKYSRNFIRNEILLIFNSSFFRFKEEDSKNDIFKKKKTTVSARVKTPTKEKSPSKEIKSKSRSNSRPKKKIIIYIHISKEKSTPVGRTLSAERQVDVRHEVLV